MSRFKPTMLDESKVDGRSIRCHLMKKFSVWLKIFCAIKDEFESVFPYRIFFVLVILNRINSK